MYEELAFKRVKNGYDLYLPSEGRYVFNDFDEMIVEIKKYIAAKVEMENAPVDEAGG